MPAITATILGAVVTGLGKLMDTVRRTGSKRTQRQDQALTLIYAAANETRLYIEQAEASKKRDRPREQQLVRLWTRAALPVRHIDPHLADRCLLKADLWINPSRWTPAQIREFHIGINEVYEYARQLLQE